MMVDLFIHHHHHHHQEAFRKESQPTSRNRCGAVPLRGHCCKQVSGTHRTFIVFLQINWNLVFFDRVFKCVGIFAVLDAGC